MHRQLEVIEREFEAASARLRALAEGAQEEEWHRRPPSGGWSAAECIAHLNLTAEATLPSVETGLEEARSIGGTVPSRMRRDPIGWLIWKGSSPGGRMKTPTKPAFIPAGELPKDQLVQEFERLQAAQLDALRRADGLPIHRVKIRSAFDPRARYSVFSALAILSAHELRHLGQAERAIAAARKATAG